MKITVKETAVFSMLGTLMFLSKLLMEPLPNIHLIGALTVAYTLVYRKKALYPIYISVVLTGLYAGFNIWWVPYLYIWTVLWGITMLLPQKISKRKSFFVYAAVCGLHGFIYGILYAPAQAIFFGLDFKGMITWIGAGLPFDLLHGFGNLAAGALILPIVSALRLAQRSAR